MQTFFIYIFLLSVAPQNISTLDSLSFTELKKYIESRTEYKLYYVDNVENLNFRLNFTLDNENLIKELEKSFSDSEYIVSHRDKNIFILKNIKLISELTDPFESDYIPDIDPTNVTAELESKIYQIGNPNKTTIPLKGTITGYIRGILNGDPVIEGAIYDQNDNFLGMTDYNGFYKIEVPTGKAELKIKSHGFQDGNVTLSVSDNGTLDIMLKNIVESLSEITVTADRSNNLRTSFIGIEKISVARMRHIPVVFGETDIIKVILTLPGVKSIGEAGGGFNVRGGSTDQNLVLFNGSTIYNVNHMFGIFSAINSDVVSNIELYKSSIPAKYGGRLSSILEINSKKRIPKKLTGSLGVGLLTSNFNVEFPFINNKTTVLANFRTTYSNWLLSYVPKGSEYSGGKASFNDGVIIINHTPNARNFIQATGYFSNDKFSYNANNSNRYANRNASIRWNSEINSNNKLSVTSGIDHYDFTVRDGISLYQTDFHSEIEQYFIKGDLSNTTLNNHKFEYGISGIVYNTLPGKRNKSINYIQDPTLPTLPRKTLDREKALEAAIHLSDTWQITDNLDMNAGVRLTFYSALGARQYYVYSGNEIVKEAIIDSVQVGKGKFVKPSLVPEFRFSIKYNLAYNFALKFGINTMSQNIHLITSSVSASPTSIWKLSDANIAPQRGGQIAGSIIYHTPKIEFSLEGYYKVGRNFQDYKSGEELFMNEAVEQALITTNLKAYGAEMIARKPTGKLNGWISYTYSRVLLKEAGEKEHYNINDGEWYAASWDKPHEIKMVGNYKFTHRYSISMNVDYATGRPVTIPIASYWVDGSPVYHYTKRNSYRIPDFFKIDLAFNIEQSHKITSKVHTIFTFGIYNLTGRKNAYSVYVGKETIGGIGTYQLSIFGSPIPYATILIKF